MISPLFCYSPRLCSLGQDSSRIGTRVAAPLYSACVVEDEAMAETQLRPELIRLSPEKITDRLFRGSAAATLWPGATTRGCGPRLSSPEGGLVIHSMAESSDCNPGHCGSRRRHIPIRREIKVCKCGEGRALRPATTEASTDCGTRSRQDIGSSGTKKSSVQRAITRRRE